MMQSPTGARKTDPELTVISLGAGVQSSVMALMAAEGLLKPMPDYAIFADTGWEPAAVYEHLEWLKGQLPFPVHQVSSGNLREHVLAGVNSTGQKMLTIPAFLSVEDRTSAGKRQCTREYKLKPIHFTIRDLLGLGYKQIADKELWVELWLGISTDEAMRMKPSREPIVSNYYPLIELLGMSRTDCQEWFEEHYPGRSLPSSSCIGCPYHSDEVWQAMKEENPEEWEDAVFVDAQLRVGNKGPLRAQAYLHRSLKPLSDIIFEPAAVNGQPAIMGDECEGLCGV